MLRRMDNIELPSLPEWSIMYLNEKDEMTVLQAAKKVGRNPETLRRHIREGKLVARKVGNMWVIPTVELEAYG